MCCTRILKEQVLQVRQSKLIAVRSFHVRGLCCKALIYELEEKQPKLSATIPKSLKKETCLPAAPDQYSVEARVIGSNHTIIDIYMYKTYTNH